MFLPDELFDVIPHRLIGGILAHGSALLRRPASTRNLARWHASHHTFVRPATISIIARRRDPRVALPPAWPPEMRWSRSSTAPCRLEMCRRARRRARSFRRGSAADTGAVPVGSSGLRVMAWERERGEGARG